MADDDLGYGDWAGQEVSFVGNQPPSIGGSISGDYNPSEYAYNQPQSSQAQSSFNPSLPSGDYSYRSPSSQASQSSSYGGNYWDAQGHVKQTDMEKMFDAITGSKASGMGGSYGGGSNLASTLGGMGLGANYSHNQLAMYQKLLAQEQENRKAQAARGEQLLSQAQGAISSGQSNALSALEPGRAMAQQMATPVISAAIQNLMENQMRDKGQQSAAALKQQAMEAYQRAGGRYGSGLAGLMARIGERSMMDTESNVRNLRTQIPQINFQGLAQGTQAMQNWGGQAANVYETSGRSLAEVLGSVNTQTQTNPELLSLLHRGIS